MSEQAKERIKAYLEEQIKNDTALAAVYDPEKIGQCFTYITDQARKVASGNSCWVDDAEVWKWARDYYLEEVPKEAERIAKVEAELDKEAEAEQNKEEIKEEPAVDVSEVKETVEETAGQIEQDAKTDNVKRTELGFEVFGEDADEPEEAVEEQPAEEPCNQEEVEEEPAEKEPVMVETEKSLPKYDEEGNGLFDFM